MQGIPTEEAIQEAGRCLQCECMECVKVCEFLASFKGYPKKYIRQIYNNLSIVMGQRHGNKLINSCSICGLCKEVCPEDLHMGEVCKAARETMVNRAKCLLRPMSSLSGIWSSATATNALCTPSTGDEFQHFPVFSRLPAQRFLSRKCEEDLRLPQERLRGGVGLMLGCCGAPADWSRPQQNSFSRGHFRIRGSVGGNGQAELIVACSTCYSVFKAHLPHMKMQSLWEVMDTLDCPKRPNGAMAVAVHDPCTSRHETAYSRECAKHSSEAGVRDPRTPSESRPNRMLRFWRVYVFCQPGPGGKGHATPDHRKSP